MINKSLYNNCLYVGTIITLWLDSEGVDGSFLVPTIYGTNIEGVVCPQDQSRAPVTLIGSLFIRLLCFEG